MQGAEASLSQRQYRLDAVRGIALLIVFIDHCEWAMGVPVLSRWTLGSWYWCDAAEVFVFVAGIVCGKAYLRSLQQCGFVACATKGFKRAKDIFLANVLCLAVIIAMAVCLGPPREPVYQRLQYQGLEHGLVEVAIASVSMGYQPMGVDVLTLYVQFVVLLPLFLACWQRWPLTTKFCCLGCYLGAQWLVGLNVPRWPFEEFPVIGYGRWFHHIAWNCLFFLGALVAVEQFRLERGRVFWIVFGGCIVGVVAVIATSLPRVVAAVPVLAVVRDTAASQFGSKLTLGPMRLTAFLILAFVVSVVFTERGCLRLRGAFMPFILLGRNSLAVFTAGLVLCHATWWASFGREWGRVHVLVYEAFSVMTMLMVAALSERAERLSSRGIKNTLPQRC